MKRNSKPDVDREVKEFLEQYTIHYSTDLEKEKMLNILKGYLPLKKKANKFDVVGFVLGITLNELISTCKYQYLLMILLFLFLLPGLNLSISPYLMVFFIAPIPLFIGFGKIFSKTNQAMIELEKTFKYSYYQILCARIVTLTYISILFLTLPLGCFIIKGLTIESLSIFKLIISGLTPIFVFSTFLLIIASANRDDYLFAVSLIIWGLFGFAAASTPIGDLMFNLHVLVYVLIIIISVALLVLEMKRILKIHQREIINI